MKQLSAMGNRRHYYRNSAASRNLQQLQQQQQGLNEQINTINGTIVNQPQQGTSIGLNMSPSLLNRQLTSQSTQSHILSNSNIITQNNSQLNMGNNILHSNLVPSNGNNSFEITNDNNDLINGNMIVNNNSGISNTVSNNYIHHPGNKLPIMNYNYFN